MSTEEDAFVGMQVTLPSIDLLIEISLFISALKGFHCVARARKVHGHFKHSTVISFSCSIIFGLLDLTLALFNFLAPQIGWNIYHSKRSFRNSNFIKELEYSEKFGVRRIKTKLDLNCIVYLSIFSLQFMITQMFTNKNKTTITTFRNDRLIACL